jgi:hypothetical protein
MRAQVIKVRLRDLDRERMEGCARRLFGRDSHRDPLWFGEVCFAPRILRGKLRNKRRMSHLKTDIRPMPVVRHLAHGREAANVIS